MNRKIYNEYVTILESELVPALGCTEPIALAYAAAKAKEVLGKMPDHITMRCSGNIIKNVKGVKVPNSGGMKGVEAAAVLGITGGDPSQALEVLEHVTDREIDEAEKLLKAGFCDCVLKDDVANLYIEAYAVCKKTEKSEALVVIEDEHTNITHIEKDGQVLFHKEKKEYCQEREKTPQNTIEYKGKTYRRNTYVKAILCMGIDRREPLTETKTAGAGGQSDGIFLVAQDTARDRVQVLAIPRDTMTPIPLTDLSGNILGYDTQHLTLAYAYGDGREKSCQFMCQAVTELLDGLQIDGYMAVSMGALKPLNDAVDGVTVTIDDPELEKRDPAFKPGTSVTLMGDQAEAFLRYRDTGKSQSAVARLERQKGYIAGYAEAVKKKASREEGVALKLLETAAPYMVTNLSKDQYLDMMMAFIGSSQQLGGDDIRTLPGEGAETRIYDEYHPDPEGVTQMVLDLFYRVEE